MEKKEINAEIQFKLGMTAKKLLEDRKGLLSVDERAEVLNEKFEKVKIECTAENRMKFREYMFKTEDLEKYIGGVILNEETFTQKDDNGELIIDILRKKGITLGVKLDKGFIEYRSGEQISVGIEDLELRCKDERFKYAEFAKWRSLFHIFENSPTTDCIADNCKILARYAAICQRNGLVPIIEPEISNKGDFKIDRAEYTSKMMLSTLCKHLNYENVFMPGVIIKTNFITPGMFSAETWVSQEIGERTFRSLISTIPCAVTGVVFLSGGLETQKSIEYLKSVNLQKGCRTWRMSFSYGRALTTPFLKTWKGQSNNIKEAQKELLGNIIKLNQSVIGNACKLEY